MPWKLYVDSRKRQPGTRGDSVTDFAVALPYPISVKGKAVIDMVLLSNSFYTVRTGENDQFYLDELAAQTKRVATLAEGQYTVLELKDALVVALNANKAITGQYAVAYLPSRNRLQISIVNAGAGDQFRVWPQELLVADAASWSVTAATLQSANRPLGFMDGSAQLSGGTVVGPNAPNVQPYAQLFMRSNLGGSSTESLGPNYENDIVRRIVVGNTPVNGMIHDAHATEADCVKLSGSQEFSLLWFQIIDVDGKVVDTHGLPVSFSIIFQEIDDAY